MRLACLLLVAACGTSSPSKDVVGPFTGEVHTYYVDGFTLPKSSMDAHLMGDDLNGDRTVDNQLGVVTGTLAGLGANDLTTHGPDMIAAGVIRSTFEIQADDLQNDPAVGVRYVGAPGADAVAVGGTIVAGEFSSNRTATSDHLGRATVHLPIFEDVDPVAFDVSYMEIDLTPDPQGGYNAAVRGLVGPELLAVAAKGVADMIAADPADHAGLVEILDPNHHGGLDAQSLQSNGTLLALLESDTTRDGAHYDSFGFALHLSPTPASGAPADLCHDRVKDPGEADVDCGGTCLACAGDATCGSASDCQSQRCAGTCVAVSCSDGARDGLETDIDCGGWECGGCAAAQHCVADTDCTSGHCGLNTCQ